MARRRNGPAVFCLSVGIVLTLAGLMTFLALPAAARLDQKEAYQEETPLRHDRERGVQVRAYLITGAGVVLGALGGFLLARKPGH